MRTKFFVSLFFVILFVLLGTSFAFVAGEYDPCGHFLRWTLPGFNSESLFWFGSDPATNLTIKDSYEAKGRYFLIGMDDVWVTGVAQSNIWGCYVGSLTQEQVDTMVAEGNYPQCLIVDKEGNIQSIDLSSGARCLLPEIPTPTPTPELTPTVVPTGTPTVEPTPVPSRVTLEGGINRDSTDGGWVSAKAGDSLNLVAVLPFDIVGTVYSSTADDIISFEIVSDPAPAPFVPEGKGTIVEPPQWDNGVWHVTVRATSSGLAEVVVSQLPSTYLPGKTYSVSVFAEGEQKVHSWTATVSNGKKIFFSYLPLVLR